MLPATPRSDNRRARRRFRLALTGALAPLAAACAWVDAGPPAEATPDLVSVAPVSGPVHTRVWLNGWRFERGARVYFGGLQADSVEFVSAWALVARAPAGIKAGATYTVEVRNPDGRSDSLVEAYRGVAPQRRLARSEAQPGRSQEAEAALEAGATVDPAPGASRRTTGERALLGSSESR